MDDTCTIGRDAAGTDDDDSLNATTLVLTRVAGHGTALLVEPF